MAATVKQEPGKEVPVEVLASEILAVSNGMKKINDSRLSRRALLALLHDRTQLSKSTIERVLDAMSDLEKTYLKKV